MNEFMQELLNSIPKIVPLLLLGIPLFKLISKNSIEVKLSPKYQQNIWSLSRAFFTATMFTILLWTSELNYLRVITNRFDDLAILLFLMILYVVAIFAYGVKVIVEGLKKKKLERTGLGMKIYIIYVFVLIITSGFFLIKESFMLLDLINKENVFIKNDIHIKSGLELMLTIFNPKLDVEAIIAVKQIIFDKLNLLILMPFGFVLTTKFLLNTIEYLYKGKQKNRRYNIIMINGKIYLNREIMGYSENVTFISSNKKEVWSLALNSNAIEATEILFSGESKQKRRVKINIKK